MNGVVVDGVGDGVGVGVGEKFPGGGWVYFGL